MKNFYNKKREKPLMPETARVIKEKEEKPTEIGFVYYETLAKQRARIDAKNGDYDFKSLVIPHVYEQMCGQKYFEEWHRIVDKDKANENGQKICNS